MAGARTPDSKGLHDVPTRADGVRQQQHGLRGGLRRGLRSDRSPSRTIESSLNKPQVAGDNPPCGHVAVAATSASQRLHQPRAHLVGRYHRGRHVGLRGARQNVDDGATRPDFQQSARERAAHPHEHTVLQRPDESGEPLNAAGPQVGDHPVRDVGRAIDPRTQRLALAIGQPPKAPDHAPRRSVLAIAGSRDRHIEDCPGIAAAQRTLRPGLQFICGTSHRRALMVGARGDQHGDPM